MDAVRKPMSEDSYFDLHNGDRMKRSEFHLAYSQMPHSYRAELIGGIVFEPSPVSYSHGTNDSILNFLLVTYAVQTPGVQVSQNATVMLGDEDEVQPDIILRRVSGGRSRISDKDYVEGPPELVAEIAHTSRAIDLHLKRERYALAGVQEYIVVCVRPKQVYWFDLRNSKELKADKASIFRSSVFPGLWLHAKGLLKADFELTSKVVHEGLRSTEHEMFLEQLRLPK